MLQLLACILLADFLTGVIHWAEDTYGLPTWPLLGESVIEPNILHHENQLHFTMSSFMQRNYQVWAFAAIAINVVYATGWLTWQLTLVAVLASMGNEVHAWAHKRPSSRVARLLQDMKIVISPEQHARHHRRPYDTNFCTLTNWLNSVLDVLRFWKAIEWSLLHIGVPPQRCSVGRRGY